MRTLQIFHLPTATPSGQSAPLTPPPPLTLSLHLISLPFSPSGGGRWPPSTVQLCSRFLPTAEGHGGNPALRCFTLLWADHSVSL